MSKLSDYITSLNITNKIDQNDIDKTEALLNVYANVAVQAITNLPDLPARTRKKV